MLVHDRILMKFGRQRELLVHIKKIFLEVADGKSGLSVTGLQSAMAKLHTPLEKYAVSLFIDFYVC